MIAVLHPVKMGFGLPWIHHLAGDDEQPICGASLPPEHWELGHVGSIADDIVCPDCAALRPQYPALWNEQRPTPDRCVYIFRMLGTDYYKIGIAKNVNKRLTALQHASPVPLLLVWRSKYYPTELARAVENQVHYTYYHLSRRQAGSREWFCLTKEDVKQVQKTIEDGLSSGLFETAE